MRTYFCGQPSYSSIDVFNRLHLSDPPAYVVGDSVQGSLIHTCLPVVHPTPPSHAQPCLRTVISADPLMTVHIARHHIHCHTRPQVRAHSGCATRDSQTELVAIVLDIN